MSSETQARPMRSQPPRCSASPRRRRGHQPDGHDGSDSAEQFRFLSENLADGMVYQIDSGPDGRARRFSYLSPAVERLHGLTVEDAQRDPEMLYSQVMECDRQRVIEAEERAFETRTRLAVDVRVRLPSGEIRWRRFISAPREDRKGHVLWDGIELDITEQVRVAEAAERTQRLEALGILAGGIAHDFNNLLGNILSQIELAMGLSPGQEIAGCLQAAMETMDRARGLTRQLLTFAKGGAPVRRVAPLFPFVEQAARSALGADAGGITLAFEIDPGLWSCSYDRDQLGQVVDNLVINARQAMPSGGRIRISASNRVVEAGWQGTLPAGRYVRMAFEDSGIGMPRAILARIFDPFFTTKQKGSGLGLATCHSIVRRHGGSIEVESEPGRGATFHVWLPAAPTPEDTSVW